MFDLFIHVTEAIKLLYKTARLRQPSRVFLVIRSEENSMLKFVLILPPAGAFDVITRRVSVQIGSNEPVTYDLPKSALETEPMLGEDNDVVSGSLVDIDDAGNQSPPRDFEFILLDTIAPPLPGEIGLRVDEEIEPEEEEEEPSDQE
jgi:hypothetical protein